MAADCTMLRLTAGNDVADGTASRVFLAAWSTALVFPGDLLRLYRGSPNGMVHSLRRSL